MYVTDYETPLFNELLQDTGFTLESQILLNAVVYSSR